jgi:hypothetical protein
MIRATGRWGVLFADIGGRSSGVHVTIGRDPLHD